MIPRVSLYRKSWNQMADYSSPQQHWFSLWRAAKRSYSTAIYIDLANMTEFSDQWELSCPCNKIILNSRNVHERHWGYNYMHRLLLKRVTLVPVIVSMYASKLLPLKSVNLKQRKRKAPLILRFESVEDNRIELYFFFSCVLICKQWRHICRITEWQGSSRWQGSKTVFHSNKYFFNIKTSCNCLLFFYTCLYILAYLQYGSS